MRLAHLADPHLGFRQFHRLTHRGQNQREVDVAMAFSRAIDGVITQRPDVVTIAGDLFHAVRPTNAAILHTARELARLRGALPTVPVIVIAGNHDTPRSSDTVSIFGLLHDQGVHVATDSPRRLVFPDRDLSVLAVPHAALFASPRPGLDPAGSERFQVLVVHGETPDLFGTGAREGEPGGALLSDRDLSGDWSYVALGHYHVQHQVGPRRWYAGSLDYVSSNPWLELREERSNARPGKGWLLVDLETGEVTPQPIDPPRVFRDLPWLDAAELGPAELDRLIAETVETVPGGIADRVVRQVVLNVPRSIARELDPVRLRSWKALALHFQIDLRRPQASARQVGMGAPGHRQSLPEMLREFLGARAVAPGIEVDRFVERGVGFLHAIDQADQEA